ncbi:TVP38/TMEM64 family protein [Mycolicibacterium confluentis]
MPAAVRSTIRQIPRRRIMLTAIVIVILIAVALLVPVPTAVQLRDWAQSLGPWFPLAFLALHSVVTVLPFPRTAFTLAAGLLFGAGLGIALAVVASAISALIALIAVRAFGWQISSLVSHPSIDSIDAHLRRRGWLAVMSLRLIPAVPFSVINYAAGASAVRVLPYLGATIVGLAPGTAAVVILGDALTGRINPTLVLVSVCTACVGVAGLIVEIRNHRRTHAPARAESGPLTVSVENSARNDEAATSPGL